MTEVESCAQDHGRGISALSGCIYKNRMNAGFINEVWRGNSGVWGSLYVINSVRLGTEETVANVGIGGKRKFNSPAALSSNVDRFGFTYWGFEISISEKVIGAAQSFENIKAFNSKLSISEPSSVFIVTIFNWSWQSCQPKKVSLRSFWKQNGQIWDLF